MTEFATIDALATRQKTRQHGREGRQGRLVDRVEVDTGWPLGKGRVDLCKRAERPSLCCDSCY